MTTAYRTFQASEERLVYTVAEAAPYADLIGGTSSPATAAIKCERLVPALADVSSLVAASAQSDQKEAKRRWALTTTAMHASDVSPRSSIQIRCHAVHAESRKPSNKPH
jgi:hypothetical protein